MASRAPQHALDLFQAGYAPTVVFSAGTLKDAPRPSFPWRPFVGGLSEADGWAFRPSPPSSPLSEAQSTYDEARGLRVLNLRTMAQEHEWQTLILVTDAFHTRRAARTFRALLPGVTFCRRALRGRFGVRDASYNTGFYWANYGIRPF
jgi:hypothetical protein